MATNQVIFSVVGARPQFIKLAPMVNAFKRHPGVQHHVIHTGQHYDAKMSKSFFDLLELPEPLENLGIGSASHASQTGAMLKSLEECFLRYKPMAILVYGDTNSTLAATLAAVKLHIPVAHIEAGLRSFNRTMPEEINRIATDHISDKLYAPTPISIENLKREDLGDRSCLSGDVMRDAVNQFHSAAVKTSTILGDLNLQSGEFALLTLHRAANTSSPELTRILSVLQELSLEHLQVVFPVHPRTRVELDNHKHQSSNIIFLDPLNYHDMLTALDSARFVITDSGGLQKEAAFLQTPCITLREETEWSELTDLGVNQLVGSERHRMQSSFIAYCNDVSPFNTLTMKNIDRLYGTGKAADIIVGDILKWLN